MPSGRVVRASVVPWYITCPQLFRWLCSQGIVCSIVCSLPSVVHRVCSHGIWCPIVCNLPSVVHRVCSRGIWCPIVCNLPSVVLRVCSRGIWCPIVCNVPSVVHRSVQSRFLVLSSVSSAIQWATLSLLGVEQIVVCPLLSSSLPSDACHQLSSGLFFAIRCSVVCRLP